MQDVFQIASQCCLKPFQLSIQCYQSQDSAFSVCIKFSFSINNIRFLFSFTFSGFSSVIIHSIQLNTFLLFSGQWSQVFISCSQGFVDMRARSLLFIGNSWGFFLFGGFWHLLSIHSIPMSFQYSRFLIQYSEVFIQ